MNLYQRLGRLMPNKGTGRTTPTRACLQVLGNIFNEQVRNGGTPLVPRIHGTNVEVPTTNLSRHNQAMASPQMMQFEPTLVGTEQAQSLSNTNARTTSSLLDTSIPRVPIPTVRPPGVSVTSLTNTLINNIPRMSSVVMTTPMQMQTPASVAHTN